MKIEFTNTGFKTTKVVVNKFEFKQFALNWTSRLGWIEFTEKRISRKEYSQNTGRYRCEVCRTKWEECNGDYLSLATVKGRKNICICHDCSLNLIESGVPYFDRQAKRDN